MKNTKNTAKILLAALFIGFSSQTFAQDESTTGTDYFIPSESPKLESSIDGDNVYFEWDKAESDEDFKYYKVVYSNDNKEPVYPDDTTMQVIDNYSTNYYKGKIKEGYWRICTIYAGYYANSSNTDYRSCSNVVYLEKDDNTETNSIDWEYVNEFVKFIENNLDLSYDEFKEKTISELKEDYEEGNINDKTYAQVKEYIYKYSQKLVNENESDHEYDEGEDETSNTTTNTKKIDYEYVNDFVKFMENNLDLTYDEFKEKTMSELNEDLESGVINKRTYQTVKVYILKYMAKFKNNENEYISDNTEENSAGELSDNLRGKADNMIKSFRIKLNNSGLENEEITKKINKIIEKLKSINTTNINLNLLIEYLVNQLEELKTEYEFSIDNIESLFDIED